MKGKVEKGGKGDMEKVTATKTGRFAAVHER
jgi:hypothetical protein